MTGDPLDRIEALWAQECGPEEIDADIVRDVLALVEVARAARVFLEEHQRQKAAVLGEFDLLVYDEMETRLREALARLEGGTE